MSLNVQSYVEDCDDELAREIKADVAYVKQKTGIDVSDAEVKSVEEMGDAAGTCMIETKDIDVRVDTLAANNAKFFKERRYRTGSFRHVIRHEAEHAKGNRLEGTTELVASKELGVDPVPAYREKVRAANTIVGILGWDETMDAARQEGAEVLLVTALVLKFVEQAMDLKEAAEKAEGLVKKAA